ncbi:hypothetical protein AM588_10001369 [Phytophthora nicotianae]|uniref:DDE-1 domain-containing protein n=1 Tax=Phytophthora nicotianae TaxID=4792 RepID=A0A0W8CS15_PHYNI|nr:hypothetical protein AM588_10001369 [Phytophthora nicotianae]
MSTFKFCEWLTQLDESMHEQNRRLLQLVDNVTSHNEAPVELTNVKVSKLPPNTTAALQLMNQRIIKCLKDKYKARKQKVELDMFYSGIPYTPVNLYTAMKWCSEGLERCFGADYSKLLVGYYVEDESSIFIVIIKIY